CRRGRAGRDRRQVRRLPRAPARGDRAPAAPRDHAHSRRLRLRAGTRPVRRSAAEARARAPGNHRPGAAHPGRHAGRHLPVARPRIPVGAAAAAKGLPMRKLILLPFLLLLAACGKEPDAAVVVADPKQPYAVHEWPIPAQAHSGQPDLASAPDGRVLLTWISRLPGRRPALMYVGMAENGHLYSSARSVVVGDSLMASWANVPHIAQTADGALWVQFMQKRGEGHAGDIALARSSDGGFNWSTPIAVNDTSIMAAHGFAPLWPVGRGRS